MKIPDFKKFCTPAQLYLAISVISVVIGLFSGIRIVFAIWKLLFAFIWAYILNLLCKKGMKSLSWFLVLLPYIMLFLAMFGLMRMSSLHMMKM